MLDQNTDRMWFVIGAVIVGAGIILLANQFMPELFASIADNFNTTSQEVSDRIHLELSKNTSGDKFLKEHSFVYRSSLYNVTNISDGYRLDLILDGEHVLYAPAGIGFRYNFFEVGTRYNLRFNMKLNEGFIETIGGHAYRAEDVAVYIDGSFISNDWSNGKFNYYPKDYETHQIDVLFTYVEQDPDKVLVDPNIYIQPNRSAGVLTDYNLDITNIEFLKVGD